MEEPYYSSNIPHNLSLSLSTAAASPATNSSAAASSPADVAAAPLDYDVAVILAAMICALVCALGLNSMLQCVFRCTRRTLAEPAVWVASRRLNCGLKRELVVALPVSTYSSSSSAAPASSSPSASPSPSPLGCPICLSDFSDGDKVRVLPACGHRFHVVCIDTWLLSHCSCPTCRNRLSVAAEKKKTTTSTSTLGGSQVPLDQIVTAA